MFKKLSDHLDDKYKRRDELSRQLEIVKLFDIYKGEIKKLLPHEEDIKPVSLRNKILTVATSSAVVASELRFDEARIVKRINQVLGKEAVKRVVYRF